MWQPPPTQVTLWYPVTCSPKYLFIHVLLMYLKQTSHVPHITALKCWYEGEHCIAVDATLKLLMLHVIELYPLIFIPDFNSTMALWLLILPQTPFFFVSTRRCVADEQRALALGVQSVVFRIFGSIPGPIVFGVIFDSACIYWQYECGERGHCWVYDNDNLKLRAFAMGLAGLGLNVVLSFTAWALYPSSGLSLENGVLGADSPDERSLLPLQDAEKEENCSVQEDEEEEEEMTTL